MCLNKTKRPIPQEVMKMVLFNFIVAGYLGLRNFSGPAL